MSKKNVLIKLLSIAMAIVMVVGVAPLSGFVGIKIPNLFDFFNTNVSAKSYITSSSSANGSNYTSSTSLASKLNTVFSGDIDIYTNSGCTSEVSMPLGKYMDNSKQYYVKSKTTGNNVTGWQCYIYANAVYNKLFNEWPGHGTSFSHSKVVISGGSNTASYSMFSNAGVKCGAYMRTTTKSSGAYNSSGGHSLIILSYDQSYISYLEGNGDGNGLIRIAKMTWSEFNSGQLSGRSRYISHVVQPTDSYYASLYGGSQSGNYTSSFTFNAHGGTLGSSGSFSTSYGHDFQILNTTCTRSGYTWSGWHVKRNNDNKWYVDGQGWCTESQISSNGYVKKVYSNYQTCKLDDSWTSGISGNCSYTFYAIWTQSPSSVIKVFFSPYGKDYDYLTAMNNQVTSGFTQEKIYAWYVIYDSNTGALFSTYSDRTYTADMTIYDPNGELVYNSSYNNSDANWIATTPQMSGTYTISVKVSGQVWNESPTTTTYEVAYDTELSSSHNSISLNLNGTNSVTPTIHIGGSYPGEYGVRYQLDDGTVASAAWTGNWNGNSTTINVTGKKYGSTNLTISVYENYTGSKNIVASIVIPVTVTANSYTISYNANGGSGVPSSQTKYYGTDITLSNTRPTRSGYTFLGWSTSSTATSATYQPGGAFSTNANTTLYAVWSKNTYNLTYNANGGTNAPTGQSGSSSYTISSTVPTRFGYTFLGWSKSSSATSATFEPGGSISLSENTTLYAVWKAASSVSTGTTYSTTVGFANQEIYYTFTPSTSGNYTFESTGSLDSRVYVYSSSGAELGYNDDDGVDNNFKLTVILSSGTKYYVKVRAYNTHIGSTSFSVVPTVYSLSYNANGGTGAPSTQSGSSSYIISSTVPTRFGYTFLGWSKNSSATSATYEPGDSIPLIENTTLYAVWKSASSISTNNLYTATVDFTNQEKYYTFTPLSTGSYIFESTGSLDSMVYVYNSSGTQIDYDDQGSDEGNNFKLTVNLTSGAKYYVKVRAYSTYTGSTSFYVVPVTYSLSYNANGGTNAPAGQSGATSYNISSTKPTRTGYTFLGWSTSSSATSAAYQPGNSFTPTENTTLYAVWRANTYTIKYNANGGSGTMSDSSHTYNVSKALTTNAFTRNGYTFLGWSTSSTATSATYTNGQSVKNLTSTDGAVVNLYAVWSLIPKYTVSYNANGGSNAPLSQTKTKDVTLTLSSTKPIRTGYTFLGWSTSSTATTATYQPGSNFTTNANTTLYAVWRANTYTIKYNANGGSGTMSDSSHTYDVSKSLTSNAFTRSGYTFLGWSTSSTATSATYTNGQTVTNLTSTDGGIITLYAVWKSSGVSLSVNTSNNATISMGGEKKYYTFTPSESGTYVIYSTGSDDTKVYLYNSSGTEITYDDDGGMNYNFRLQYNLIAGTTYRFAVGYYDSSKTGTIPFKFGKVYTVSYNANGGSNAPSSQNKDYGTNLTLSSTIPTRSGYTFLGWSTSNTATSAAYTAGGTYSTESNATLYAVWSYNDTTKPIVSITSTNNMATSQTVTINLSDNVGVTSYYWGTNSSPSSSSFTSVTSATNKTVTKTVSDAGTYYLIAKDASGNISTTSSVTFYKITLDAVGGNSSNSYVIVKNGSSVTLPIPTRAGYTFVGWGTSPSSTSGVTTITASSNKTYYAIWRVEKPDVLLGDVNGDGKITIIDYTQVLKHVKKTITLGGNEFTCADVNGDGKITVTDYTKILKHVKKIEMLW